MGLSNIYNVGSVYLEDTSDGQKLTLIGELLE